MATVAVARYAMATRFEIILHGPNEVALRAAGEEALDEIERLEAQLSLYKPTSQIAHLNARAALEPVRVDPQVFRLLEDTVRLHQETRGAFDITIGPLMRAWGFMQAQGEIPDAATLAEARSQVGMHLVQLDPVHQTVSFARPGVMLDFGAIGKGFAVQQAADILREAGVENAIIHGDTSSVFGLGKPPETDAWKIALEYPPSTRDATPELLAIVPLRDEALSVSAVWGKSFTSEGQRYGHLLDPRTGEPTSRALMAAVVLPSATETDALSTALLVEGVDGQERIAALRSGMRLLVVEPTASSAGPFQFRLCAQGIEIRAKHSN